MLDVRFDSEGRLAQVLMALFEGFRRLTQWAEAEGAKLLVRIYRLMYR